MPFPFSICYTKPLRAVITPDNQPQVLEYIKRRVLEKEADNIVIHDNEVTYKGTTSNWRHALFLSVDSGAFTIISLNGKSYLGYNIRMYRASTISAAIAIIFTMAVVLTGGLSQTWLLGTIAFFWISCVNALISWFRHEDLVFRIAICINDLMSAKDDNINIERKEESEKLKSWF